MSAEDRLNLVKKFIITVNSYVGLSHAAQGINYDSVFDRDYPPEAWEEYLRHLEPDKQGAIIKILDAALERVPEKRAQLVKRLCEPQTTIIIGRNARLTVESELTTKQVIIDIFSMSQENILNMREGLRKLEKK